MQTSKKPDRDGDKAPVLQSSLNSRLLRVVILAFMLALLIPALYQAAVEFKDPDGIQILHLFKDLVQTPQQRAADLRSQLLTPKDSFDAELVWQRARQINRHVELDSSHEAMTDWNRLRQLAEGDSAEALQQQIQHCLERYDVRSGFVASVERVVESFFKETVFSRKYLRAWEKKTEESSRFALYTRPSMQWIRYQVFGDLGEKGVVGNGGASGQDAWSFYRPGVDWLIQDPKVIPLPDSPIQAIVEFRDQLKARDIELLVVIVPVKASIYADRLSSHASKNLFSRAIPMLDSLLKHQVHTVDLFKAFAEERALDQGVSDALYLAHDTHWRTRGLKRAAKEISIQAKGILKQACANGQDKACSPATQIYEEVQCTVDRDGDVLSMTQLPQASFMGKKISFKPQTVDCAQVYQVTRDSLGQVVDSTLFKDDFRNSQVLLLGDSFSRIYQTDAPRGAGLVAHVAKELGQPLSSIVSDGGASTLVREKLARKSGVLKGKTLVIWEFVERDLRFGAEGWKRVDL